MSKEFFEALLETFARKAEAGLACITVLVLDNAGWHGAANLKIPDGIRLVYLPPYSPELQPAETLWTLVDEPIVNKHIANIEELDAKIAGQCVALAEQREQIRTRTGFHWSNGSPPTEARFRSLPSTALVRYRMTHHVHILVLNGESYRLNRSTDGVDVFLPHFLQKLFCSSLPSPSSQ